MPRETITSDIGFLIRDMIEDHPCTHIDTDGPEGDEVKETPNADHVDHVDISDAHNPRIVMASGAIFVARIVREG